MIFMGERKAVHVSLMLIRRRRGERRGEGAQIWVEVNCE